jgi:hypothetical protein
VTDGVQPEGRQPLSSLRARSSPLRNINNYRMLRAARLGSPTFVASSPGSRVMPPGPSLKRFQGKFQPQGTTATPSSPTHVPAGHSPSAPQLTPCTPVDNRERFPLASHAVVLSTASLTHP